MRLPVFILLNFMLCLMPIQGQTCSRLVQMDSCKYRLIVTMHAAGGDSTVMTKELRFKVLALQQADINNDGRMEFLLKVSKKTVLDPTERVRINIFKIENQKIVPMWLSSFMPHPLYDFEVKHTSGNVTVLTIELEQNGNFMVSEYKWHSFGLKFMRYIQRNISLQEAHNIITQSL